MPYPILLPYLPQPPQPPQPHSQRRIPDEAAGVPQEQGLEVVSKGVTHHKPVLQQLRHLPLHVHERLR